MTTVELILLIVGILAGFALAFVSFLAGYGFAVFGERRARERDEELAAAEEDLALYWNSPSTAFVSIDQLDAGCIAFRSEVN